MRCKRKFWGCNFWEMILSLFPFYSFIYPVFDEDMMAGPVVVILGKAKGKQKDLFYYILKLLSQFQKLLYSRLLIVLEL
jgi:hypothetical protein